MIIARFKNIVVWFIFFAMVFLMFQSKKNLSLYYPSVSARYPSEKLTPGVVQGAIDNYETSEEPIEMSFSFWGQTKDVKFIYNEATVTSNMIFYQGNVANIYPTKFIRGGYPTSNDMQGCAISEQLAWNLFKSSDVIGMTIIYDDVEYIIRGVFECGEDLLSLVPIDEEKLKAQKLEYSGIEFYGEVNENRQDKAKQVMTKVMLPETEQLFDGKIWIDLLGVMSYIPLLICALWMFVRIFLGDRETKVKDDEKETSALSVESKKWKNTLIILSIAGLFAFMLPKILDAVPSWIVPSQWSNFSYWDTLGDTLRKMWIVWLSANPGYQDILVRNLMLKHILLIVFSILSFLLVYIFSLRNRKPVEAEVN